VVVVVVAIVVVVVVVVVVEACCLLSYGTAHTFRHRRSPGWIWVTEMTLWLPKFSAGFAISVSTEAEDEELAIGGVVVESVRARWS